MYPMSVNSESPVMPASPAQVVPMEIIRPRPVVFYGEEPRRTGNQITLLAKFVFNRIHIVFLSLLKVFKP